MAQVSKNKQRRALTRASKGLRLQQKVRVELSPKKQSMGLTLTSKGSGLCPEAQVLTNFSDPRQVSRAGGAASGTSLGRRKAPV